jgi:hypothetical protein
MAMKLFPIESNDLGSKMKIEKARVDLVPPEIIFGMAAAFEDGAKKRSERNWEFGPDCMNWSVRERLGACLRHVLRLMLGETLDPVSGLHHAAHLAANAAMIYTRTVRNNTIGKE